MSLLITELCIDTDGLWAVAIINTGADADVSGILLPATGGNVFFASGAMIAAGETITIGHSAIPGMD